MPFCPLGISEKNSEEPEYTNTTEGFLDIYAFFVDYIRILEYNNLCE